jgi:predicted RNA-binding protein YlxR (DUF448 family)
MRKMNTNKHIPLRTCIVCRQTKEKRQLVRLLCNSEGIVQIDNGGRKPGRGAYLCRMPECWNNPTLNNRLEHSLRANVNSENLILLSKYVNIMNTEC